MMASYGGFRKGELLGLEWDADINFDTGVVSIHNEAEYTTEKGHYTDTPKTGTSERSVKLPQVVIDELKKLKAEQDTDAENVGDQWEGTGRVFVDRSGKFLGNSSMYNWFKRFCDKHGLPCYGLHSFRHFNATHLINNGEDIKTVSSLLGHANTSTTLNIYAHEIAAAKATATDKLASMLNRKHA